MILDVRQLCRLWNVWPAGQGSQDGGTLRILGSTGLTSRVELILTKALLQLARDTGTGARDTRTIKGTLKIPNISLQKSDRKNIIFNIEMISFSFEISENCLSFGKTSSMHSLTFDRYSVLMINTVLWFYQNFHVV